MPPVADNMWALLIGVDCYMPNVLSDGVSSYHCLTGCVRDIMRIEHFLRSRLGLSENRILKLTASNMTLPPDDRDPARQPAEPREQWPTYENMVGTLKDLAERADPGDQVYIHYSGHGGRARTVYPNVKGADGFDEALVPTDIGDADARYLRDVEIAHLLQAMVGKELLSR